jgi:hypothetical protein
LRKCDFWGDPHFKVSFFRSDRFDYQGIGVFGVASSADGSFQVQNFQCAYGDGANSVAIGVAVRVGQTIVVISNATVSVNGTSIDTAPGGLDLTGTLARNSGVNLQSDDKCSRINVNSRATSRLPRFFHNVRVRMAAPASTGLCGKAAPHTYVSNTELLFSTEQITELCSKCTGAHEPEICKSGGVPNASVVAIDSGSSAADACANASPEIPYSVAEEKCQAFHSDPPALEACMLDFCASGGEESMVDNAIEEAAREPPNALPPFSPHAPTFLGCFKDDMERMIDYAVPQGFVRVGKNADTVDNCASLCADYIYMGIQNGDACMCGNTYETGGNYTKVHDGYCDHPNTACSPRYGCGGYFYSSVFYLREEPCSAITSWDDSRMGKCDMWGDPHFRNSFFGGGFDFQGIGVFEMASSDDGAFQVQDFQCAFNYGVNSVAIGVAVKVGHTTVVIINKTVYINGSVATTAPGGLELTGSLSSHGGVFLDSADKCSRINVHSATMTRSPHFLHNVRVRMKAPELTGICGKAAPHTYVANNDLLFTTEQIQTLCSKCTVRKPDICNLGGVPNPGVAAPDNGVNTTEACANAVPPINYSTAEAKCSYLTDPELRDGCILDYCSSGGDDEVVDNAGEQAALPTPPPENSTLPENTFTPDNTSYTNMTRVCSVFDCPWWCLDGCHAHVDKGYINSRSAMLTQAVDMLTPCEPPVLKLFHTFLCREPEAIACAYLSVLPHEPDLAKLETAMKHSSEYSKGGCKK